METYPSCSVLKMKHVYLVCLQGHSKFFFLVADHYWLAFPETVLDAGGSVCLSNQKLREWVLSTGEGLLEGVNFLFSISLWLVMKSTIISN